jgi:hypothetical protein
MLDENKLQEVLKEVAKAGDENPAFAVQEILNLGDEAQKNRKGYEEKLDIEALKYQLLYEGDWKKRAAISALIISKKLGDYVGYE